MGLNFPPSDSSVLRQRSSVAAALAAIVPDGVIDDLQALKAYESDALTAYRQSPLLVVLPRTTAEVSRVLRYCSDHGVKVVPRGAGTSLSGGALPLADGVVVGLSRLNRILDVDTANGTVTAQPGVTNLAISKAVSHLGFHYAPDPSSQIACSIGGNVAENAGGVHCLKYGVTSNHVLGVEIVLMDGEVVRIGGKAAEAAGYDWLSVIVGSEGLLGIVTEVVVRIVPTPLRARAALIGFADIQAAATCVANIIGAGIIPAGMELMDRMVVHAAEAHLQVGYPQDVEALLIVEVDGVDVECDLLMAMIEAIAESDGASHCSVSTSDEERLGFWSGRKAAFPAIGRLSPDYYCVDGTIPRRQLACVLARMKSLADEFGLTVANVFHAGDGNLHPMVLYDAELPGMLERAEALGAEILRLCVEVGGVLSGEHGIGVEKRELMPHMFDVIDLAHQQRIKCVFDPQLLLNPGKVFPTLHRCAELGRMHVHDGNLPHADLPRF